jgi:branched-chain amino acid transport system substrate-binding protein
MYAFVAGKIFEKAAGAVTGDVTSASLKTALYSFKDETFDGLTPPITYTQGKPTSVNCYFLLGVSGGKFTEPNGAKTQCAPDAVVSGVLQALAKS